MSDTSANACDAWADAGLVACLFALDPPGFGGVAVRALAGPVRDRWLAAVRKRLPAAMPVRKIPLQITDDRLLGGLDLTATLRAGKPVAERGLLAELEHGVAVLPMAERWTPGMAARLTAVLDRKEVVMERDGFAVRYPVKLGVIALDEGMAEDECVPVALLDRCAFHLDLEGVSLRETDAPVCDADAVASARERLSTVDESDMLVEALCAAAAALGITSIRAVLLAMRVARAAAALAGRSEISDADAAVAGRLVFAPRATILPAEPSAPETTPGADLAEPAAAADESSTMDEETTQSIDPDKSLDELVVNAAKAALPESMLAQLRTNERGLSQGRTSGKSGAARYVARRGRPAGVKKGEPRDGARLNIVETLRAAAPWQQLRRQHGHQGVGPGRTVSRVAVRADDLRINRYKKRTETTTIFVVDASGSSALQRLSEAKGAVELMLADCYVRRDRVALVAFRGDGADLLLPPTRSLVRAKRSLVGLPGGGGTPLAAGIEAAVTLAEAARRRGETPTVILLTDGRANVALDGAPGRGQARDDAQAAARRMRIAGIAALLIDTSPRPRSESAALAAEMGALYLPLPHADANRISQAVDAATRPRSAQRALAS